MVGQIGRDLVLRVDDVPAAGGSAEVRERRELLGGKGANQAVAVAQLGATVGLVGVVGADRAGEEVLAQARRDGIDVTGVVRRPGADTALLADVVAGGGERRLFEHVPAEVLLTPADIRAAAGLIGAADVVSLQLQQPPAAVLAALRIAQEAGRLVVLDGAPEAESRAELLRGADILRADGQEAELLVGRPLDGAEAVVDAARELVGQGPGWVALAAGAAGDVVAWPEGHVVVPRLAEDAVDPTGAGDATVATLAVGRLRGLGPAEAAWRAGAAAALTVARLGGRPDLSPAAVEEKARGGRAG